MILDADFFGLLRNANGRALAGGRRFRDVDRPLLPLEGRHCRSGRREETGRRAVLNYGHTFAHALETVAGYAPCCTAKPWRSGWSVRSRLAERLGRISAAVTARQIELLTALRLPTQVPQLDRKSLMIAMARDKKANQGRLRFVLPTELGHVELVGDVDVAAVEAAWEG